MKHVSSSSAGVFGGAHKWLTGILTTSAALLAVMVNARSLGITPWFGLLDLNFADHAAHRIVLAPRADTLRSLGDTAVITATVTDAHGAALAGARLRWRSTDSTVATVDSGGAVVARAPGTAQVEVMVREVSGRATVVVRPEAARVVISGDSAVRLADGDSLRLIAHALDARGHRIAALVPRWQTADSQVVMVDSLGNARALAAGRAYLWAGAGELRSRVRVDVELTPAAVVLQSGEGQRAPAGKRLLEPVVLQVRARGGQPVPGSVVTLVAEDGDGVVTPDSAMTDGDGRIRASWTLGGRAGMQRLRARVAGVDSTLVVNAEAEPVRGNVRVEVLSPGLRGPAGSELGQPVLVRVTDTLGLALALVRVGWTALEGGTTTGSDRTDSTGTAQAYWTLGRRAGRQRLRVQVGNPRSIPATDVVAVGEAGAPAAVVLGKPSRPGAGGVLRLTVTVTDALGNPVPDVELEVAATAGSLAAATLRSDSAGRAGLAWTPPQGKRGEVRITARLGGTRTSATQVIPAPAAPAPRPAKPRRTS